MRKRLLIVLSVFILLVPALYAQESDVIYIEGWVDVKNTSGDVYELIIGDRVFQGETIITGEDGIAELEPESGSRIIVKPGTVFSILETSINGKKQTVVSTTIGQVSFKFNKMTQEPLIATPSTVMGVRGTEFNVWAAADGASLVEVTSGAVEVSGQGESVLLESSEAVQVDSGSTPGEKIITMGKATDHSNWNANRIKKMMETPVASLTAITAQLNGLSAKAEEWAEMHETSAAAIDSLREKVDSLFGEGKDAEAQALYKDELRPLEIESLRYVMNYRYYALSALSMRQYILGGFYVRMKTAYISDRNNPIYTEFMDLYQSAASDFDKRLGSYLVEADY